jgi:hypothetical protein
MALTSPPSQASNSSKHKVKLIAGASAAGGVVLAAIIAFIIWRTRRSNRLNKSPVAASVSNEHSSSIDEEKIRDSYVPQIQSLPSSQLDALSESTLPDSPTDNSSFSKPMILPSSPIFPPEIQSDDYPGDGNVPIRQTTLATSEKRAIKARQGPEAPSNVNSGFYSSAISNMLYNTTRVPSNQGISVTTDMQSSSNRPYDISPLKNESEKEG